MATSRSIPSLDGLRACSIGLVLVGHSLAYLHGEPTAFPFLQISGLGQSGVDTFFVISGFLITYLLLKENEATGAIGLHRFYFRRFFRIFPPFYVYLAAVAVLSLLGVFRQDLRNLAIAGTYTWDYIHHGESWLLGHTWSLSLEEQFYVIWPPCLAFWGAKKARTLALSIIALSPAIRLFSYVLAPSYRGNEGMMLHTRLDTIMFGCALALLWKDGRFQDFIDRFLKPWVFAFAAGYVVVLAPCLSTRFGARYDWTIGYTVRALFITLTLVYVVKLPHSKCGRFLNLAWMRHVGIISYSLYLWQQPFTGPNASFVPFNWLPVFACAEASYWLIERPSFKLRDRLESWFQNRAGFKPSSGEIGPPSQSREPHYEPALMVDK